MSIPEIFEALMEAGTDYQASEVHCVNVKNRQLTEFEIDEWNKAARNYQHVLAQSIAELSRMLEEELAPRR